MQKHKFNVFPEMDGEEFSRLVDDISGNGFDVRQPIYTYQGAVLDGWNRWRACDKLKIAPQTEVFFGDDLEAIDFVMRTNKRRNITSQQWATIATEADEVVEAITQAIESSRRLQQSESRLNNVDLCVEQIPHELTYEMDVATDNRPKRTAGILAKQFNTNEKYVQQAQKLKRDDPEKFEAVKQGTTTFQQIKKQTVNEILDTDDADEVTRMCRDYGFKFQKAIREFNELKTNFHRDIDAKGLKIRDIAENIYLLKLDGSNNDAHFLKKIIKCPLCNASKCDTCKTGYVDSTKKEQILDRAEYIKNGGYTVNA